MIRSNCKTKPFDQAAAHLPAFLQDVLSHVPDDIREVTREIRIRAGGALTLTAAKTLFFTSAGRVTELFQPDCLQSNAAQVRETLQSLCNYSLHSYTDDINRGFLTLPGGHRAGVCGTAVRKDDQVCAVRDVSSINLRIARDVPNASRALCDTVFRCGALPNVLIAGAPGSGKTTLLRDIACRLSAGTYGAHRRVAIVDERGELAGVRDGMPCRYVGATTDVLTGYTKREGILLAMRSLSPEVILCDELGPQADADALEACMYAGISFVATVHANSLYETQKRPITKRLLALGAFDWLVQLQGANAPCTIAELKKHEKYNDPETECLTWV
ncbi:MAG: stage III sporulation protein AA [Oscillospiraceae bacterium]|nr:stage III sporulation protein AA [Oscillospiraceae bacterium]